MDRVVVAMNAVLLAVVDCVLELANDVHPHVHVGGALLRPLNARRVVVGARRGEVDVAVGEAGRTPLERRLDPGVGVHIVAVVVVELLVLVVRAAGAGIVHLGLRRSREPLDIAAVLVLDGRNSQRAERRGRDAEGRGAQAPAGHGHIRRGLRRKASHEASDVPVGIRRTSARSGEVGGDVLEANLCCTSGVGGVGLAGHRQSVLVSSTQRVALREGGGESRLQRERCV
mmetsp:Transcript_6307/g.18310  ORF Transcript_6307/g.18310 Transcript_6307/m.18310 type:complete len:229 (-) Transcript_6307:261-947(-)